MKFILILEIEIINHKIWNLEWIFIFSYCVFILKHQIGISQPLLNYSLRKRGKKKGKLRMWRWGEEKYEGDKLWWGSDPSWAVDQSKM